MKRKFNKYAMPSWVQNVKRVCGQFIIPICIFQGIRTILLPTTFDVLLLAILILIALGIFFDVI
jgi:hypothetical protein